MALILNNTPEGYIRDRFFNEGIISGNELYFPLRIGRQCIDVCLAKSIAVLGVDFFHIKDRYIIPVDPLSSIDCSEIIKRTNWNEIVLESCTFAQEILYQEQINDETQWCNFTLLSENEWHALKKVWLETDN